jgi:3-deoxy-D-manno-octulosonate 8-phosphate phosphatase KdsC-like HAD superfamily phosphatase
VTSREGGSGAVREVADIILAAQDRAGASEIVASQQPGAAVTR